MFFLLQVYRGWKYYAFWPLSFRCVWLFCSTSIGKRQIVLFGFWWQACLPVASVKLPWPLLLLLFLFLLSFLMTGVPPLPSAREHFSNIFLFSRLFCLSEFSQHYPFTLLYQVKVNLRNLEAVTKVFPITRLQSTLMLIDSGSKALWAQYYIWGPLMLRPCAMFIYSHRTIEIARKSQIIANRKKRQRHYFYNCLHCL